MLYSALNVTSTGLQAASSLLDVVSNNIANSSTTGYKAGQATFQDLLYTMLNEAGANTKGITPPGEAQLGEGVVLDDVTTLFTQGTLTPTGQTFDLAISGDGFFPVRVADGTTAYTRRGDFTLNDSNQIATLEGYVLGPGLTIPSDASKITIRKDGAVTTVTPAGVATVGQLDIARFPNPSGLLRIGDTLFAATPVSGAAVVGTPGLEGRGIVVQELLEESNVNLASELTNLVVAQQSFLFNSQALQAENEALAATTAELFR